MYELIIMVLRTIPNHYVLLGKRHISAILQKAVSGVVVIVVSGVQLTIAYHHMSTSFSTEGSSEPNQLLRGA